MTFSVLVSVALVVQILCAFFFVFNILTSVLGLAPISWEISELIEIGAAVGLLLGIVMATIALRVSLRRAQAAEERLRVASTAFHQVMRDKFHDWGLTPAECDVALFAIKGLSIAEIAGLRSTSEGTVKAQTAAIYRKAGVGGRPQLLSLFIEDLLDDSVVQAKD